MDQLVRYHDRCRETSKLARDLGKTEVAEWIDLRIEEGEAQQAAKNKVKCNMVRKTINIFQNNSAQTFSHAAPMMVSILLSYFN